MSDNHYNNFFWPNTFYHQYMQQHAAMTQWIQGLHSNMPSVFDANQTCHAHTHCPKASQHCHAHTHCPKAAQCCHARTPYTQSAQHCHPNFHYPQSVHCHANNTQCPQTVHYQANIHSPETLQYNSTVSRKHNFPTESTISLSESSSGSSTSSSSDSERNESTENYEEDESDCEFELNVDAILAMRKAKEELNNSTSSGSSSIVMVERAEEFEFVDLASEAYNESVGRSIMVGGHRDRMAELDHEKKVKEFLYGEKFATIAGLEMAMLLSYQRCSDVIQPITWPVYPFRLPSRVI